MIDSAPSHRLSQKIIRNTLFNLIRRFWAMFVALLLTPYIVSKLGTQRFGLWPLISVITGYFGLLDLGIGLSFIKKVRI